MVSGRCGGVLVGDYQDRPDFPPSTLAGLTADTGAATWVTLACRDRNRITLEQALYALALDQLTSVLGVAGDGRGGVSGVNLAGLASAHSVRAGDEIQPEAGRRVRAARGVRR